MRASGRPGAKLGRVPPAPPPGLSVADEGHHAPTPDPWWSESWSFDFARTDASLGGYVRIGLHPNRGVAWYWASLVGEGRRLVSVVDHTVALPRPGSLEVRAEGLWADHTVEVPFDHVTVGCEAFALGLDDPADMYGDPRGDRVPFGLDLEWEADGRGVADPPAPDRYDIPCVVHGEVLVGQESIDVEGVGGRAHEWGVDTWWTRGWTAASGWLDDGTWFHGTWFHGTRFHGTAAPVDDGSVHGHRGYVRPPGAPPAVVDLLAASAPAPHGVPGADVVELGGLRLDIEAVAFAPVLVDDGAGRRARLARALCRYRDLETGRRGAGWTEWNDPPR
jgi:hypothetical protein